MQIEVEVLDGVLQPKVVDLPDGKYESTLTHIDIRTQAQNRALWMWLSQIATQFNKENVTIDMIIKPQIEWNKDKIKAMVFDPMIKFVANKESSTKLSKEEFSQVLETTIEAMGRKGQKLPEFPSINIKER